MKSRRLRVLEATLWVAAVVLLSVYGWVYLDRSVYQSYQNWVFERELDRKPASLMGFVLDKVRFGRTPASAGKGEKSDELATFGPPAKPESPRLPDQAVVGRIEIPRIGVKGMILEGTSNACLRRAIGHIEGTALPGQPGNIGLAGHRDTFFLGLKGIKKDDTIRIRTLDGTFTYKVESIRIVTPRDVGVLDPTPEPTLTLVTCYPFNFVGSAPDRYIVHAREIRPSQGS
ncbi:MAG TPA: class D sortase [Bryobacteraceae bacterium]|nr:class D sortase [Bryobacteraceae bacterium]